MLSRVAYFFTTIGVSAPRMFALVDWAKLKGKKNELLSEAVHAGAEYVRSLHPGKNLYNGVPEQVAVDPNCPALEFSDQIYSLLGKNNILFDLVHAPFTRPLGTQIAFFVASNSWDAYCLYIAAVIKERGLENEIGTTDEKLQRANLLPSAREVAESANQWLQPALQCSPDEVPSVMNVGKLLRNSFVHHGGQPKDELRKLVDNGVFSQKLMRFLPDGEFEVAFPMGSKVHQVLVSRAELIQQKADELDGLRTEDNSNPAGITT
jgi:hypothetical protein